ncbi:MAG TPA: hypothetical protein VF363_09390 [Candidatus Eisenbacteria bacterium]
MRIRIPRRIVLLGVLLAALALVVSVAPSTYAKPISWNDPNDPYPPSGDGDGSVVKAGAVKTSSTTTFSRTGITTTTKPGSSVWKGYLVVLRLGYGWRFIW